MRSLEAYIRERNKAFESDDLDWVRRNFPFKPSSDHVVEMAFHKAREVCEGVSDKKRLESRIWLMARGYRVLPR